MGPRAAAAMAPVKMAAVRFPRGAKYTIPDLANDARAGQCRRMNQYDRRAGWAAVLVLTAGSIVWHAQAVAAERHEETVVLIRHGEKPAGGLG